MNLTPENETVNDLSDNEVNSAALETAIGYRFQDRNLLILALTHSSRSNEMGLKNHHLLCNERLEFLGDSVLSLVVSRYIYDRFPNCAEGVLTNYRKDVVCTDALSRYARSIHLGDCLLMGVGESTGGGRDKPKILENAFEALIAAVFIDAGQGGTALQIISEWVIPLIEADLNVLVEKGAGEDSKSLLQQFAQANGEKPEYYLISQDGPDHMKTFTVGVKIATNPVGRGTGPSIRKAEQAAAADALSLFGIRKE